MSGINAFFRDVIGVSFSNPRWSWGGVDHEGRRLFLRLWRDDLRADAGSQRIRVQRKHHGRDRPGWKERQQHIDLLRAGYQGYAVLCDRAQQRMGLIKSFDRNTVLMLGPVTETEQEISADILRVVPIEEIAIPERRVRRHADATPRRENGERTGPREMPVYLARLAYNSQRWWRPTQANEVREAGNSYRSTHGFGHEDWLFRNEWLLDGWRYGFVQGVNRSRKKLLRHDQPFHLRLFTMPPSGGRRAVAEIREAECLNDELAREAVAAFEQQGWLDVMRAEVTAAGGRAERLGENTHAPYMLNLRYRLDRVRWLDKDTPLSPADSVQRITRYTMVLAGTAMESALPTWRGRAGTLDLTGDDERRRFVPGRWITYSPEHLRMQKSLVEQLRQRYPGAIITYEEDFVDVTVRTESEILLIEVKSDLHPLSVVRQALGQILEYAYHPRRAYELPVKLVIAGRRPLEGDDLSYFEQIKQRFSLPVDYWMVPV